MISTDKIIFVPAPQEEPDSEEDISQSEMEPPCKSACCGFGGKKACDWKLHVQIQSADQSHLIDQVKDELQPLIPTDIPVAAQPYQKIKSNSPRRPEHGSYLASQTP